MYRIPTIPATFAAACALVLTTACSAPLAPTPSTSSTGTSTSSTSGIPLKAGAPSIGSPTNDTTISGVRPTLVIGNASADFAAIALSYEFQLLSDSSALLNSATVSSTSWTVPSDLAFDTFYRWQARAVFQGAVGPWSSVARFRTAAKPTLGPSSTSDEFRDYFFSLVNQKGLPLVTSAAMAALRPDLNAVGVDWQHDSAGTLRPRLFLPTGRPNDFSRAVDVGDFNRPWQWLAR